MKVFERVTVEEGYARWAKDYDAYVNPLIEIEQPIVRAMLGRVAGKRVLDAGCGTGRHAGWLHEQGAHVIGVDENESMLALARGKHPSIDLRLGKVTNLDFPDASFDVVLNALMAEHVEDLNALIASLSRVLVPGGSLVLSVFHPFMVLKGVQTHYEDEAANVEYVLPTFVHLPSDYLRVLRALGLTLEEFVEPIVDDRLLATMPHMKKHSGVPLAIVFRATRA